MIRSFGDARTAVLFRGDVPRELPRNVAETGWRKLRMVEAAATIDFLRSAPLNKLEATDDDGRGRYRIHVCDEWHIHFTYIRGDAFGVLLTDQKEPESAATILREQADRGDKTLSAVETNRKICREHAGAIVSTEWLIPLGISDEELAGLIGLSRHQLSLYMNGFDDISEPLATKLSTILSTDAESWTRLPKLSLLEKCFLPLFWDPFEEPFLIRGRTRSVRLPRKEDQQR